MIAEYTPPAYNVQGNFIAGQWVNTAPDIMPCTSPADGNQLCDLPASGASEVDAALSAAQMGAREMERLSVWDRAALCTRIGDVITAGLDELATCLSWDQGKPLAESYAEVATAADGFYHAAEMVRWREGRVLNTAAPGKQVISTFHPKGVIGVITPWNFPINIPTEYISAALAAGNSVVWIPAPSTSLCAAKFMELLTAADIPDGALNLVIGTGAGAGAALTSDPRLNGICFTGSPATGLTIARAAAGKPQLLELGGNGPVIVLDDADIAAAAQAAALGAFLNAGQVCSASERILVQRSVHDEFAELMLAEAAKVRLGHPFDPNTTMGPLNNAVVSAKVAEHIGDSVACGAHILTGGRLSPDWSNCHYFEPTVMTDVTSQCSINREETFGPVAPILTFDDDDALIAEANNNDYGLCAAVFTNALDRAQRFVSNLQTGIVNVNDSSIYWEPHIPFGGASGKKSGVGRLGGVDTINALSDVRTAIFSAVSL